MSATRLPNGRRERRVDPERSEEKEVLEGRNPSRLRGGSRTPSSPPFPSPPDRGTSIRLFIHSFVRSFVRSLVLERALACTDLPRVVANLDLQLEGKSIALDIQSGISESDSDTGCREPGRSCFLLFFFFLHGVAFSLVYRQNSIRKRFPFLLL